MWGDFKEGLGPFVPGMYSAPYAYCYRCPLNLTYPDCGIACAEKTRDVIKNQSAGEIAAIIVEPMQGTAGNVIPPPGFLPAVQAIAKENGALFIADEMITGFGRTGKFWGVDHDGVVPDVMTCGKGIGGGFPLAAVVSTDELTAAKPVVESRRAARPPTAGIRSASAAGLAALEIITRENLVENSERVGAAMLARLAGHAGEAPDHRRRPGQGPPARPRAREGPPHEGARVEGLHEGPLPGMSPPRPRGDVVHARSSGSTRRSTSTRATALDGLDILDEALGAVAREWKLA